MSVFNIYRSSSFSVIGWASVYPIVPGAFESRFGDGGETLRLDQGPETSADGSDREMREQENAWLGAGVM